MPCCIVEMVDRYAGAVGDIAKGNGAADTCGSACDEGDFARKEADGGGHGKC